MKSKTVATWLAILGGPFGLHRFYLYGWRDRIGWVLPWPSLLGILGVIRLREFGVDDRASWLLIPLIGFSIAACALSAIVHGLTSADKWQARFNPVSDVGAKEGNTTWLTVCGLVVALLIGSTALMASLAFSFQHYFEYQMMQAKNG